MQFNLLKNKTKTQEKSRGRSMVEMLGVLAIIGVLSIGGISGYTIAMRKYRANEIIHYISKYSAIVYTGFQNYSLNNKVVVDMNTRLAGVFYPYQIIYGSNAETNMCGPGYCGIPNSSQDVGLAFPSGLKNLVGAYITHLPKEEINAFTGEKILPNDYMLIQMEFDNSELCKTTMASVPLIWPTATVYVSPGVALKECQENDPRMIRYIPLN